MSATVQPQTENQLRQQIVDACRQLAPEPAPASRGANVSALWNRGSKAGLLITPSDYDQAIDIDDIVWMPLRQSTNETTSFGAHAPSPSWSAHLAVYDSADTARAVVQMQSPFAATLSCLPAIQEHGIPAFHRAIAAVGGNSIRCARPDHGEQFGLTAAIKDAMAGRRACLLANDGLIACGESIRAAMQMSATAEALSRIYWQCVQIGEPVLLIDDQLRDASNKSLNGT